MTYVELDGDLVLTFDDTLEIIDGLATVHAEIQRDREERMIAQLFNELGTKVDPHMPVNILWSIGSAHTALYDALNKGMQATDGTIKKVFSFGDGREYKYSVQIVQDKMMGVEPTEDSLAKAWLSDYIQEIIQASPRPVGHSHIQDEQVRLIADRFSLDEIKAVFDTPARKDAITKAIKTKGIKLSARKPPKIISFVR
jgi:hypothetical protein